MNILHQFLDKIVVKEEMEKRILWIFFLILTFYFSFIKFLIKFFIQDSEILLFLLI